MLYKNKRDPKELKNYRPLLIINVDYKIFIEILIKRLTDALGTTLSEH